MHDFNPITIWDKNREEKKKTNTQIKVSDYEWWDLMWLNFWVLLFYCCTFKKKQLNFLLKKRGREEHGREKEGGREGGREKKREKYCRSDCLKGSSWRQLCKSECGLRCLDARLAVLVSTLALTADCLSLHWIHTSLSLWFHLISTLPSGWRPWRPLGNLHPGSHGYFRLPDRQLRRADGHQYWAGNRLRGYLSYPAGALLFTPSPTHCACTHMPLPGTCLVWLWRGTQDVSNITNTTTIAYIYWSSTICQTMTYEIVCTHRERNNLPGQFKEFGFSTQFKHDYVG